MCLSPVINFKLLVYVLCKLSFENILQSIYLLAKFSLKFDVTFLNTYFRTITIKMYLKCVYKHTFNKKNQVN